jgi:methionine synthase I (cobalamin-dependent)
VYGETPAFFAARAAEMIAAGVSILGGCCGSTPEHVRALREVVDRAAAAD